MKMRIKFSKTGAMKFVGHLDTMRYFQKALRRAEIPVAFSEGFSPHMIMSFAAPLGVGVESAGEYFDLELTEDVTTRQMVDQLNHAMTEGFQILNAVQVPDGKASKAMSLVAAADYRINLKVEALPCADWKQQFTSFMEQSEINLLKKTKKSEMMVDIKPMILEYHIADNAIDLKLLSGSQANLKPNQVMEAFYEYIGKEFQPFSYGVTRLEVYGQEQDAFVPLDGLGEIVE